MRCFLCVFFRASSCTLRGALFHNCSVHLDARPKHARNAIQPLSGIHDFVQRVARYGSVIPYRSVHLDARPNHARNAIQPLSGIHDFVQQVARYGQIKREEGFLSSLCLVLCVDVLAIHPRSCVRFRSGLGGAICVVLWLRFDEYVHG